MNKAPAYVIISMVFFILIGIGLSYSYFFYPNEHPIECSVKNQTGYDCPTCGFSRAFSAYTHAEFSNGYKSNSSSLAVFIFFVTQWIWRGFILLRFFFARHNFNSTIIKTDISISISLFLLAFLPIILNYETWKQL